MMRAFRAGDVDEARRIHYRLLPLFQVLFCETNPIPVKAALAFMGVLRPGDPAAADAAQRGESRAAAGRA